MKSLYIITICFLSILFTNCEASKRIFEDEAATATDKLIIDNTDIRFANKSDAETLPLEDELTFFLVRHAEKNTGKDPDLVSEGAARAELLAEVLSTVNLDAIYSTDYNRTLQTAKPTATKQDLDTQIYDGANLEEFSTDLLQNYATGKILVVGHSNTTPKLINHLIDSKEYQHLSEDQFDNLFVITFSENGEAQVLNLKYGEACP